MRDNNSQYYYSYATGNSSNNGYYVRLYEQNPTVIKFQTYKNTMEILFDIWLQGNFQIPPYLMNLEIDSSIGRIQGINLVEVDVDNTDNKYCHHFKAHCNIDFGDKANKNLLFLDKWNFNTFIKVDEHVYSDNRLSCFDGFINDISKITFTNSVVFSNYFPISKLNTFYVNVNYRNQDFFKKEIPKDYFSWESKDMTCFPKYWFNRVSKLSFSPDETLYYIYKSNLGEGNLSTYFDKVNLKIEYYIDGKKYNSEFNLSDATLDSSKITYNNFLCLNIKTLYNFKTHELLESNMGVEGIYFPVKTYGKVNLTMVKNDHRYIDDFDFSFKDDLYTDENQNFSVSLIAIDNIRDIHWNLLTN